ncbi:uncharacterized protein PG986_010709 [Apiospora aurea]|uniref:Uncharacterized protein n=1 Tax=Apiospora aurea TaxID=335848 RepID=A0ABR1Q4B8_9PEZI
MLAQFHVLTTILQSRLPDELSMMEIPSVDYTSELHSMRSITITAPYLEGFDVPECVSIASVTLTMVYVTIATICLTRALVS